MRIYNLYQIRDTLAKVAAGPLVPDHNDVAMRRELENAVNTPGSTINRHPHDFTLYLLGVQDEDTGQIKGLEVPDAIIRADELLHQPKIER